MSDKTTKKNPADTAEEIKTGGGAAEVAATVKPEGAVDEETKRKPDSATAASSGCAEFNRAQALDAPVARSQEQDKEFFAKLPDPCVYCGPSVRGVARQFTVYNGGIPDALKEFVKEHRAARGLIVSVERFAQVRTRLETPGTGEFILFRKVRAEL